MSYRDAQYETLIVTVEESIAIVQLNRPKAFNAINFKMMEEICEALSGIRNDSDIRVVVLTGNDKAFAAGADIKSVTDYTAFEANTFLDKVHEAMFMIEDLNKPVIAAVEGMALGGGFELVLACDIRYVAENCVLGLPEINLGIFPGGGGTQRLPRNCSIALAKQLIFSGDSFNAATAEKLGLVNQIAPAGEVLEQAKGFAKKLSKKAPLAIQGAKQAINMSMSMDIKTGCYHEQTIWSMLFASQDQKEGMAAFIEKRKADFKGA